MRFRNLLKQKAEVMSTPPKTSDDGKYNCDGQHIAGSTVTYSFSNVKGHVAEVQVDTSKKDAKTFKLGQRYSSEELRLK